MGCADGMLTLLASPNERQIGLTDRGIFFKQVSRIYDQNQMLFVNTAAYARYKMMIRTGLR